MNTRIVKFTTEEEEALMFIMKAALATQDFQIATNVVVLRQKILDSPFESTKSSESKKN